jgi:CRISPR-associated endonuclease/helicase Cas3
MMLNADALGDALEPLWLGWQDGAADPLLRAIAGHHGRPPDGGPDFYTKDMVGEACLASARNFIADVLVLFRPAALAPPPRQGEELVAGLAWWLAGITVLADWIGSGGQFRYHEPTLSLERYWHEVACPRAELAVKAAGLERTEVAPAIELADLVGELVPPSPVQRLAGELDLGSEGPVLVLIEDQTGSGKTEAALLVAHRLMAAGRADGLFVALPTMATANGMYRRLGDAYLRLFLPGSTPSLVLAHGRRHDHRAFQDSILRAVGNSDRVVGDPSEEAASAQCAAWIAEDRRRTFFAAVGVGTIDQALLAVLPSRHAPLRLQGLHRKVLIVDEAHAYDPYMREGMLRLVRFHAGLGGSVVILSATLPQSTRRKLIAAYGEAIRLKLPPPVENSYPLVTVATGQARQEIACKGRPELARSIQVTRLESEQQAIARICEAAAAGKAVAWIRNTVADAMSASRALLAAGITAELFHSRFAMGDRAGIEARVVERFGKHSTNRHGVVVATQVIEQSLDLDFDLLISDLAPMDLLIQRAGRLWRHVRPERTGTAELLVLSPQPTEDASPDWLGGELRRTGRVYQDHALLWRTARLLFARDHIRQPEDVRPLVEAAYDDEAEYPAELQRSANDAAGKRSSHESIAGQNFLIWREGYCRNAGAWDSDINTPTRLGEPTTLLRLAKWNDGRLLPWFAGEDARESWSLSEIQVPRYLVDAVPEPAETMRQAIHAAKAAWGAWEQEIPLLVLQGDGNGIWRGDALRGEKVHRVCYTGTEGLWFH